MPFLVYAIALVISAGTLALSINLATAPDHGSSTQRVAASPAVRQIPIDKSSDISRGDPHNQLSPVYPAAPGKDLPLPDDAGAKTASNDLATPAQPEKPAPAASVASTATTGAAPKEDDGQDQRSTAAMTPVAASTPAAPNSCAIEACSGAYRSFRASDCTYQPFEGPRRICDMTAGGVQNASAAAPSSVSAPRDSVSRARVQSRNDELDAVERAVRRLPGPADVADGGGRRVIVLERPGMRAAPRVIYEEW